MENKAFDKDSLTVDAVYVSSAINALQDILYFRLDSGKVNLEDLNNIHGIVASIKCLADKHANEMSNFIIGGGSIE